MVLLQSVSIDSTTTRTKMSISPVINDRESDVIPAGMYMNYIYGR